MTLTWRHLLLGALAASTLSETGAGTGAKSKCRTTGLFDDDRQVTEKAFWNANPCLKDCRPPVKITGHAVVLDVTPDDKATRKGGVE
jgi:hypothetical protein